MLDAGRLEKLKATPEVLPCEIVLPPDWEKTFQCRGRQDCQGDEARRFVRWHFMTQALLELKTTLPTIPREQARHVVLMKSISRQGASFLNAFQLFPSERVELMLPTRRISYAVVRCVRYNDYCYEIGVKMN